VVVRRLNPSSPVLSTRHEELIERFRDLAWARPLGDFAPEFSLVGNDAAGIRDAIS
jgi:hypothetical protein